MYVAVYGEYVHKAKVPFALEPREVNNPACELQVKTSRPERNCMCHRR